MALGVPVLNLGNAKPLRGIRGITIAGGRIGFSATSAFVSSGIEKLFKNRCDNISVTTNSGYLLIFKRSATFKKGVLYAFGGISGTAQIAGPLPVCSGVFTAYGY